MEHVERPGKVAQGTGGEQCFLSAAAPWDLRRASFNEIRVVPGLLVNEIMIGAASVGRAPEVKAWAEIPLLLACD